MNRLSWFHHRKLSHDYRSAPSMLGSRRWTRHSVTVTILAVLAIVLIYSHYDSQQFLASKLGASGPRSHHAQSNTTTTSPHHRSRVLKGPPTESFRDNLLPDVQYITGWIGGGHTNDFMTYINYIYLGLLTHRVPIIGPFAPTHVGPKEDLIPFGDIYDVPRLAEELRWPVVEWRDVKEFPIQHNKMEPIGGWTIWARYDTIRTGLPRGNQVTPSLGIEVSYTQAPERVKLMKNDPNDPHISFLEMASLSVPSARRKAIQDEKSFVSEGLLKVKLPPDEHLMVIDFAYYMGMIQSWEWHFEYFQSWRVASHAHWTPKMRSLAENYLMRHFAVRRAEEIPKYIAIHVRHGDFKGMCGDRPLKDCYAPLDVIAARVAEVRNELAERPEFQKPDGSPISIPVLMTSDESDPEWWEAVQEKGWSWIDHGPNGEDTGNVLGKWYPTLIDAIIQSLGHGFVGTDQSTMSLIAQRRVEAWQNGSTRIFLWGWKDADRHHPQVKNERSVPNNRFY